MSSSQFDDFSKHIQRNAREPIRSSIDVLQAPPSLKKPCSILLEAGGKRIRPLLLFATLDAFNKDPKIGLSACSSH